MVPLCFIDTFVSAGVQGFWFPLLTVPFGHFSPHPSLFLPPTPSYHLYHPTFSFSMSFPIANSAPSAVVASPIPLVSDEAVLNEGFDHVRDWTPTGYMAYRTQFSESEPTYMQVWGWD